MGAIIRKNVLDTGASPAYNRNKYMNNRSYENMRNQWEDTHYEEDVQDRG